MLRSLWGGVLYMACRPQAVFPAPVPVAVVGELSRAVLACSFSLQTYMNTVGMLYHIFQLAVCCVCKLVAEEFGGVYRALVVILMAALLLSVSVPMLAVV